MAFPKQKKAVICIIANETFERMGSIGALSMLFFYLTGCFNVDAQAASMICMVFGGISNMVPMIGAIVSDTYLGRFNTLAFSTVCSLIGMLLLTATTVGGESPGSWQVAVLVLSLVFFTLGAAGIRSCNATFGIDQYDLSTESGKRGKVHFINWNYASFTVSVMISTIVIPVVQREKGWLVAFIIPTCLMLVSCFLFFIGSPVYVKIKPHGKSPLASLLQVFLLSYRNRKLPLPNNPSTNQQLRFLEKAGAKVDGAAQICTMEQIEEAKSVVKVMVIWASNIVYQMIAAQFGNYCGIQSKVMNTAMGGRGLHFPPASMGIFPTMSLTLWVLLYDKWIAPALILRKKINNGGGLDLTTTLQRMGAGMLVSIMAVVVAGIVEGKRRQGVVDSIFWLVPQMLLIGVAEAFNNLAQIDFFHSQLPQRMESLTGGLFAMGYAVGSFLSALFVEIVSQIEAPGRRNKWQTRQDVNDGRLDVLYLVLAGLGAANLAFFVLLAKYWYNYNQQQTHN